MNSIRVDPSLVDLQSNTIPKMGDFCEGDAETVDEGTSPWRRTAIKTS